jgi:hypothetical protein
MNAGFKMASRLGCLVGILGPVAAALLYPRARWLFGFFLIGVAVVILNVLFRKQPLPDSVADHAQRLLDGTGGTWDVDDYEHLNPREPRLRELWRKTMEIGGLPEEWPALEGCKRNELQRVIHAIRVLDLNE